MTVPTNYLAIEAGSDVVAELEVKRSRFLCFLRRVDDEDAARALLVQLRKSHHAARPARRRRWTAAARAAVRR
ncbi:MAG: hypothetical protein ITG02_16105, partial [Patulibacter sp.]|nr:hypothetical protein [Patulibacter sp.]